MRCRVKVQTWFCLVFVVGPVGLVSDELLRQLERALDAASHSPLEEAF